jgi:hypothetical protein
LKNAGALQPPVTRRLMMPLPPRPPTTSPALSMPGKTATASARSSRSLGIERSAEPIICSRTREAESAFFDASFNCFALAEGAGRVAVRCRSTSCARVVVVGAKAASAQSAAGRTIRVESFMQVSFY